MKVFSPRRKLPAACFSLIVPGLGHIYCGYFVKGCSILLLFCLLPLLVLKTAMTLPERFTIAAATVALCCAVAVYVGSVFESVVLAAKEAQQYQLKSYNSLIFYLAASLAGIALMCTAENYIKDNLLEAYKIVGTSMEPQVQRGDFVFADKTAYRQHAIQSGDIVIVIYPDNRSMRLIRKIVGVPGETVTTAAGKVAAVPHGTVMVQGFSRTSSSLDSNEFGPVDMRDVVGKVTQIYFSKGEEGIRWSRIGTVIHP